MNASAWALIRAIRGPMLLIMFGSLMALNHMQIVDFERTWPVLIIAYGVFKLLERMVARPVPPAAGPPGYPLPYQQQYPPHQHPHSQGGAQ